MNCAINVVGNFFQDFTFSRMKEYVMTKDIKLYHPLNMKAIAKEGSDYFFSIQGIFYLSSRGFIPGRISLTNYHLD